MTRGSEPHNLRWDFGSLTLWPEVGVVERPARVTRATGRARRSSANGTEDPYCHILVGSPPYRYTSCGLRLDPPLPIEETHRKPPCPNGNPPCPDCLQARKENP